MRALVTRPIEDAAPLEAALKARGIEAVVVPMMSITPAGAPPQLDGIAALLFTSANGVRAFAALSDRRDLPAFAVGPATAAALTEAGFARVETAGGNVEALAALAAERLDPKAGPLLHVAGSALAGDLAGDLKSKGFSVERAVLYQAVPIDRLPPSLVSEIEAETIDFVLLFSPRTARVFAERVRAAGLDAKMGRVTALCLSRAVADRANLRFAAKRIATRPEQAALLDLLDQAPARTLRPAAATRPAIVGGLAGLLAAAIVAAIALTTAPAWLPQPAPPDASLASRMEVLSREVAALRAAPPPAAPDLKPLADRLQALEQSVAALQSRIGEAGTADTRQLSDLSDRLAGVTQQMSALQQQMGALARTAQSDAARTAEDAGRRAGLALSAAQLAQAIAAGQPFAPSLTAVLGLTADGPTKTQLAALQPAAERGIPTVDALARRFGGVAREAKAAAVKAGAGGGWMGEIRALLSGLVTIRPTDPARGGDDTDNHLARAQAYLDSRDLAAAVAEVKALPPAATSAAARWLADAEQRLAADAALKALEAEAARGLAAGAR